MSSDEKEQKECQVLGCEVKNYIECQKCNFISCIKCTETFILGNSKAECMQCKTEYNEEYLRQKFSKSWMSGKYSKWKKSKLIERERGYLPATIEHIAVQNRIKEKGKYEHEYYQKSYELKQKIRNINSELYSLKYDLKCLRSNKELSKQDKQDSKNKIELNITQVQNYLKLTLLEQNKYDIIYHGLKRSQYDNTYYNHITGNQLNIRNNTIEELIEKLSEIADYYADKYHENNVVTRKFIVDSQIRVYLTRDQTNKLETNKEPEKKEKRAFIKPCPNKDCRGFLSTQWNCELCKIKVCKDCHEIKEESVSDDNTEHQSSHATHVCLKENIETAKMLMKETRACPKCGVRIYKIDGCDMMWCTHCNTAFSWTTGKIETRNIHNPHYFAYLRQTGQQITRANHPDAQPLNGAAITDFGCDYNGRLDYYTFTNRANRIPSFLELKRTNKDFNLFCTTGISEIFRLMGEIRDYNRFNLANRINYNPDMNKDLRISYLNKNITDKSFETTLMRRYKVIEYNKNIFMLNDTLVNIFNDLLLNVLQYHLDTVKAKDLTFEELIDPFFKFIEYYNSEVRKYTTLFGYDNVKYIIRKECEKINSKNSNTYVYHVKFTWLN
jgi:hypothetical protein